MTMVGLWCSRSGRVEDAVEVVGGPSVGAGRVGALDYDGWRLVVLLLLLLMMMMSAAEVRALRNMRRWRVRVRVNGRVRRVVNGSHPSRSEMLGIWRVRKRKRSAKVLMTAEMGGMTDMR